MHERRYATAPWQCLNFSPDPQLTDQTPTTGRATRKGAGGTSGDTTASGGV